MSDRSSDNLQDTFLDALGFTVFLPRPTLGSAKAVLMNSFEYFMDTLQSNSVFPVDGKILSRRHVASLLLS